MWKMSGKRQTNKWGRCNRVPLIYVTSSPGLIFHCLSDCIVPVITLDFFRILSTMFSEIFFLNTQPPLLWQTTPHWLSLAGARDPYFHSSCGKSLKFNSESSKLADWSSRKWFPWTLLVSKGPIVAHNVLLVITSSASPLWYICYTKCIEHWYIGSFSTTDNSIKMSWISKVHSVPA